MTAWARGANLLVPGTGPVLVGRPWLGWCTGLLFALAINAALALTLLFPDELPGWYGGLAIGVTGGIYVGAQIRLVRMLRATARETQAARRRMTLARAADALNRREPLAALEIIAALADEADHDLLIAYRLAQVMSATGDRTAAAEAWQRVERLDRHRLYRRVVRDERARLGLSSPEAPP